MTVCFVASHPGVVLAAADTRIGFAHPGGVLNHDGPDDLPLEVASLGRTLVYPYRQRKIRFLGDGGWAVVSGDFATASLFLDELRSASASQFHQAQAHVERVRDSVESRAQRETGIPIEQLRKTLIIGAPCAAADVVWTLASAPNDARTQADPGNYAANRPTDLTDAVWLPAESRFQDEFVAACRGANAMGMVKAAARFLSAVAPHSAEASLRAQIGVTYPDSDRGYIARYFDGVAGELANLGPQDLLSASEPAR
jgi:hypothetical protein